MRAGLGGACALPALLWPHPAPPPSPRSDTAVFLGIKIEACPYTEFTPFFARLARHRGVSELSIVGAEITLLQSLRYQLTMYHPYRPLKALLVECVRAYAAQGGGAGSGHAQPPPGVAWLPPADERFLHAWDVLQALAFEMADLVLLTDAIFTHSPAHCAAACLLAAAEASMGAGAGAGAAMGSASQAVASLSAEGPSPAGCAPVVLRDVAPSIAEARGGKTATAAAAVAWFVSPWLTSRLARSPLLAEAAMAEAGAAETGAAADAAAAPVPLRGGAEAASVAVIVDALHAEAAALCASPDGGAARAASLEQRLLGHLNKAFVTGTPQRDARRAAAAAEALAIKAGER